MERTDEVVRRARRWRARPPIWCAFPLLVVAGLGRIGADSWWLVAAGHGVLAGRGATGLRYASAPTQGWHSPLAAGEVVFAAAVNLAGARGLIGLQLAAAAAAVAAIWRHGRQCGQQPGNVSAAIVATTLGGLAAFVVVRAGLFSLALYPVLAALLAADARAPSRRIWWSVPLLALWANLHGGVLLGYLALACYLIVHRGRRRFWSSAALALSGALALCVTPAGAYTPRYYLGVLRNVAAARHEGLWAGMSPSSPLDILLAASALIMLLGAARGRARAWELALAVLLAAETLRAARTGVFLLMTLAPLATFPTPGRWWPRRHQPRADLVAASWSAVLAAALVLLHRQPLGAPTRLIQIAVTTARGSPILAEDLAAEQVVARGGRVWVANPIDAFPLADQRLYLDWSDGRPAGDRALDRAGCLVLTSPGSAADRRMALYPGLTRIAEDSEVRLYRKGSCADS